jgi:hypothetical protein
MTLFGSKIYDGAMICNDCYDKLSSAPKQEPQTSQTKSYSSSFMSQSPPRRAPSGLGITKRLDEEALNQLPRRTSSTLNLVTRRDQEVEEDTLQLAQQQHQSEAMLGGARKRQQEEMTPLTPAKIGGLIKAQQMKEQQIVQQPKSDSSGFTPVRPDQFSGLFGAHKKEEFIEPRDREEDFAAQSGEKYASYPQEKVVKSQRMETNLAETVGKFVGSSEYERPGMQPQKRKLPNMNLIAPKPLAPSTPVKQQQPEPQAYAFELDELYQSMDNLFQYQEQMANSISELHSKVDYQNQMLEEIYRALEQCLGGGAY